MSRTGLVISALLVLSMGCKESTVVKSSGIPFYVGTYTDGDSEGIYKYLLSQDGSLHKVGLLAKAENPSYLAFSNDGRYLLAVNEVSDENQVGHISSFEIGKDTLNFLGRQSSGGAYPCHVVTRADNFVVVANYGGGNMGLLKIQEDGRLSPLLDVQQHKGSGTHERQEAPHAHSGWFQADGSIISVDLGTNQLWFSEIDTGGSKFNPGVPPTLSMDPGAGPRHLTFHPEKPWIYVLNELASTVSLVREDVETGSPQITKTITTLPADFTGENTCADIHISSDGRFLYASNRGHNSIVIYAVNPENGELQFLGHEPVRGETPRNFSLSPDGKFLLVANQATDNIVSFQRDAQSGRLTYVDEIQAPTPVCMVFVP